MRIEIKQIKKITKDETAVAKAREIDEAGADGSIKGNKILEGKEVSLFESAIGNNLSGETYKALFGFDRSEKSSETPMDMTPSSAEGNFVASDKPSEVKVSGDFNPDGSLKGSEIISGAISLTDADGNVMSIPLEIDAKHLYGSNKKQAVDKVIQDLQKAIDGLPANLKSDLMNEINKFYIGSENTRIDADDGRGARFMSPLGSFSPDNSTLTLNRLYDGSISKDGINTNTLAHELGHAKDQLGDGYQSQTNFAQLFSQLTAVLKTGSVKAYFSHKDDLEQGYWLKNQKEAFAELTGYFAEIEDMKKRGDIPHFSPNSRYYLLNQVMTSDDPKIKPIVQKMLEEYRQIAENSNSANPVERKGNNNINVAEKRIELSGFKISPKVDKSLYNSYISLIYEDDLNDMLGELSPQKFLLQYWQYSHKDGTGENDKAIFNSLDDKTKELFKKMDERANANPPLQSWVDVRAGFDKYLKNLNLIK